MKTIVLLFISILVLITLSLANDNSMVGVPESIVVSSKDTTFMNKLNKQKADSNKCIIIKDNNGEYFWETRGHTKLNYSKSGAFDIYTAENGSGLVKVQRDTIDWRPLDTTVVKPYSYIEFVHNHLTTLTYFGKCNYFNKK